jgi:hypothetical protein
MSKTTTMQFFNWIAMTGQLPANSMRATKASSAAQGKGQ